MNNSYEINLKSNYSDLFLLLNNKEKLESFFNYFIEFVVKETREKMNEKEEDFFPVVILNEKAKVIEFDYSTLVKSLAYWLKDTLNFSQWEDVLKIFSYSFTSNKSKATNESIFLTSFIFGMFHRCTSIGFDIGFGVTGYRHLFSVPMIYKSKNSKELMQYAMVTIYLKKLENAIDNNALKDEFYKVINYGATEFEQVAFGTKACKNEWGAENQNHYNA
jgi:hypothetical protein